MAAVCTGRRGRRGGVWLASGSGGGGQHGACLTGLRDGGRYAVRGLLLWRAAGWCRLWREQPGRGERSWARKWIAARRGRPSVLLIFSAVPICATAFDDTLGAVVAVRVWFAGLVQWSRVKFSRIPAAITFRAGIILSSAFR